MINPEWILNPAQTIYTVIWAIFYAVSIASTNGLNLFDTTSIFHRPYSALKRIGLTLVLNNLFPLYYFWIVINKLEIIDGNQAYSKFSVLFIIFLQSIVGFGFYRILFGFLTLKHGKNYYFYSDKDNYLNGKEEKLINPIQKELENRPRGQEEFLPHFIPGLFWVFITYILLNTLH